MQTTKTKKARHASPGGRMMFAVTYRLLLRTDGRKIRQRWSAPFTVVVEAKDRLQAKCGVECKLTELCLSSPHYLGYSGLTVEATS